MMFFIVEESKVTSSIEIWGALNERSAALPELERVWWEVVILILLLSIITRRSNHPSRGPNHAWKCVPPPGKFRW